MGGCGSKSVVTDAAGNAAAQHGGGGGGQNPASSETSKDGQGQRASGTTLILDKATPDVTSAYNLGRILGKGQFGTTRLAVDRVSGDKLACKTISKRKLTSKEDIEDVKREVQIMHHLSGHQNITVLKAAYEDKHNVHLVMELCSGGELFDRIVARGHYSEKDAAAITRTIVEVVAHCHNMSVIHRDLKPENFLLSDQSENAQLKATDFGLSVFFKPGDKFSDVVGSAYYIAPEVLQRRYSHQADIWSCGVILYILLSGVPPFWGESEREIFAAILKGHVDFESDPWPAISALAKDCVKRMLVRDPNTRATAEQILKHDWLKENGCATDKPLKDAVVSRIKAFAAMNKLKKEVLRVVALNLPTAEIQGLKQIFSSMDADKSGTITVQELREGLKKKGAEIPEDELKAIMEATDVDGDGTIDYEEFLAATLQLSKAQTQENLLAAFTHFDSDNSGFITLSELEAALSKVGKDKNELRKIIEDVDRDGDGRINYEEFCEMMQSTAGEDDSASLRSRMRF